MLNKYSNELVMKYILGEDIFDYEIEKLENDYDFMLQVLNFTKDKNMYNFCSEDLKNNFEFVKNVIEIFKKDKNFVRVIADDFLTLNKPEESFNLDCVELNIIMTEIDENKKTDKFLHYYISSNMFYQYFLTQVAAFYSSNPEKEVEYGKGFIFAENLYTTNPKIIEYIAKKIIENIFYENEEFKFEELIHNDTNDASNIEKQKEIIYLINFIKKYDDSLSWYVSCHKNLLNEVNLNMVRENWKNFELENMKRKFNLFQEKITTIYNNYCDSKNYVSYNFIELFQYILQKYNLENEYKTVYGDDEFSFVNLFENKKIVFDKKNWGFQELSILKQCEKVAEEIFSKRIIGIKEYMQLDDYSQSSEKNKTYKLKF